jgi:transcriptional regulator with XRE-family HTH domain
MNEDDKNAFGLRIKACREARDWTLADVCRAYNERFKGKLNKSSLSRYENGQQEPLLACAKNLARIFDVSLDYLAGRDSARIRFECRCLIEKLKSDGYTFSEIESAVSLELLMRKQRLQDHDKEEPK